MTSKQRPIYNDSGAVVGYIKDGWIEKRVDPARHKLRKPSGWATDHAHIAELCKTDGKGIRLHLPNNQVLEATLDVILDHAIRMKRGHGVQVVLPDKWWTTPGQAKEPPVAPQGRLL